MAWRKAIIWTKADPINWRIYAATEGEQLIDIRKIRVRGCFENTISYFWQLTEFR